MSKSNLSFDTFLKEQMKDPEFVKAYEQAGIELQAELAIYEELKRARNKSKLTQAQIAEKMGTKQSAVARLEAGVLNAKLETIMNYARAIGLKELRIAL